MQEFERFIVENAHACICAFKSLLRQRERFVFPFLCDSFLLLLIGKLNDQVLCHILKNNLRVNLNRYQEMVNWLVVIKRIEILLLLSFALRRYKDGSGLLLFPFLFSNKKERNLKPVNNLVNLYAPGKRLLPLGLRKKHIFAVVVLSFFLSIYIYIYIYIYICMYT